MQVSAIIPYNEAALLALRFGPAKFAGLFDSSYCDGSEDLTARRRCWPVLLCAGAARRGQGSTAGRGTAGAG